MVVEFKDQAEKPIRTLLLGKKHMKKQVARRNSVMTQDFWMAAKVGTDSKTVILIADPLDNMEAKPDQWLDKGFFHIEKARTVEVDFRRH